MPIHTVENNQYTILNTTYGLSTEFEGIKMLFLLGFPQKEETGIH